MDAPLTSRRRDQPIYTPTIPEVHRCGGRVANEGINRWRCQRCEQAFRQITVIL